jgi:hypothetical protein
MVCFQFRKVQALALAAAGMVCLAASEKLVAADDSTTPPNIKYTATGVFASPPITGNDLFQLQGEPFSISVVASSALAPTSHTAKSATYTKLKMSGTVTSAIEPTPESIKSANASSELAIGNPKYDLFEFFSPVSGGIIGVPINISATIQMPAGTLTKTSIRPFASITLGPCTLPTPPGACVDQVTYKDPQTGVYTTLGIASGTLVATVAGKDDDDAETPASVQLHVGGAQVITAHADGTQSVRSIGAGPVDLGASSDAVALRFYAAGVRDGAEIHVQIAGHDAPVLYSGPAGHFPGLDEISVTVPRSLAGSGDVEVALTVDGRTASPVHIQIQ